jgi:AAA domain
MAEASDPIEDDAVEYEAELGSIGEPYRSGFVSISKSVSLAEGWELKRVVWRNGLHEALATWHGIDRQDIVDECWAIADAKDLLEHFGVDAIQADVAREFEAVPIRPAPNGNGKHHEDEAPYTPDEEPPTIPIVSPFPIDESKIPPRDWAIPGFLMRRQITVLVAPSGSGKSLLTLQVGLACTVGQQWANWRPRGVLKVLFINSEDDVQEMTRRLAAAIKVMDLIELQHEIAPRFAIADDVDGVVVAKFDPRKKILVRTPHLDHVINTITQNRIDIVFVDPFAETFEGDENSNSELKWAGVLWREVARRTNAAVCLVHHTKKYASGMAGDVDAARGASALIGIARIVSTLFPMTAKEAETMEISDGDKPHFLRYDDAKANLNLKSPYARWFRKRTMILGNAIGDLPPDEVGALEPWTPPAAMDGVTEDDIIRFFMRLDQGLVDSKGHAIGEFYTFSTRKTSEHEISRYIGGLIMDVFGCEMKKATDLLKIWQKHNRFREYQYYSKRQRKVRAGVFSESGKVPDDLVVPAKEKDLGL